MNDWKDERSRVTLGLYLRMKNILHEQIPECIPAQTHKRNAIKTSTLEISEKSAWVLGMRDGDRDEDEYSIGIGTSTPEIATEFIKSLESILNLEAKELWCQITVPKNILSPRESKRVRLGYSETLNLPLGTIRVRPRGPTENHRKNHMVIRYYNKLTKTVLQNMDSTFRSKLTCSDLSIQGSYLKGLIDSEGIVKDSGRIVIEMRQKSFDILELAAKISQNLGLRYNLVKDDKHNIARLTIYGPVSTIIEFSEPFHVDKSKKLRNSIQYSGYRARVPQQ